MERLLIIDAYAVIHRAYHALPPMTGPQGQAMNAVYGFVSILLRTIDELKPKYLIIAFDLPVPTFRHHAYVAYQATRPSSDEGFKEQVNLIKEVIQAAGITVYAAPGFEADDVIGTLAKQAIGKSIQRTEKRIDEVIIITGDRDILQLVNEHIKVYMPIRGINESKLYGPNDVKEYLGITPEEIIDYKALVGDSSDNYPGVPGIGPKTAITLLQEFGSLDGIYDAIQNQKAQNIKHKVIEKLAEGYESALLSQKLARIETAVPVELDLKAAELIEPKENKGLINKLKEFGFRSLVTRLGDTVSVEDLKREVEKKRNPPAGGNGQMDLV